MPRRLLPASRAARVVALLSLVVVVAVVAVAGWRQVRAGELATGEAEWIWRDLRHRPGPSAFYAVRDFRLAEVPEAARLLALGDEEYVLYLNGFRVGSNRYRPGAPIDVYPVAELLLAGPNRLVAELRSSRGAGGFLAALEVEEAGEEAREGAGSEAQAPRVARPVVTDASWRIVPRHPAGLLEGWLAVTAGAGGEAPFEEPVSWGPPPTGRWDYPRRGGLRPVATAAGEPCDERPAAAARGAAPQRVVFDFGREVTGYLAIQQSAGGDPAPDPGSRVEPALFATGDRPPRPLRHPGDALPLLTVPGSPRWTDVVPRRFRYAAVVGLDGPLTAAVLPVAPDALDRLPGALDGEAAAPGLFGLQVRGRRTPTEDAVRRRLQEAGAEPAER